MKRLLLLICCHLLILILSGCFGGYEQNLPEQIVEAEDEEEPEKIIIPKNKGTLNLSMRSPKTLNPLLNEDVTVDSILKLVFEPLVTLDETKKPVPNIATEFIVSTDGLNVLITLDKNVKWSDGTSLTADDVIFSINTIKSAPEQSIYKRAAENISTCAKIDEHSLKINYSKPFSGSNYLLVFPVIPKHYYDGEKDAASEKNMNPLGNGYYKFVTYKNLKHMLLTKNTLSFKGTPYIENVNVIITSNYETDLYAFDQNLTDVISADIDVWSKYRGQKETNITEYDISSLSFVGFNFKNSVLAKKSVRRAIAYGIDYDSIVSDIYLNHATKAKTPVNPVSWLYEEDVLTYAFSIDRAKAEYLKSGTYVAEEDKVSILVNEENEARKKIAEVVLQSLTTLSIPAQIEILPFEQYSKRLEEGNFDIFIGSYTLSPIPDFTFMFHSQQADSGTNYFNYKNEEMDKLLELASNATSEVLYKKTMSDVQKLIADELPIISIAFKKTALITDARIYGDKKPLEGNIYRNISEWFLETN